MYSDLQQRAQTTEHQYMAVLRDVLYTGYDIPNERTGISCRTVINRQIQIDASTSAAPILTTRKFNPKIAIAELLGYLRGYTNAQQFADVGTKTWFANANETPAWVNNPNRKGENDLGQIYGAVARNWPHMEVQRDFGAPEGQLIVTDTIDLIRKVYENLKVGKDDRGEILSFWDPGRFHLGALRPCMFLHQFSLLGDDLYLTSIQRSTDTPLGYPTNLLQVWLLLRLFAQITGKTPKTAVHQSVNTHIYASQLQVAREHADREPLLTDENGQWDPPRIEINPDIETLEDLQTWVSLEDFEIYYPRHHPALKYPFAV